MISGGSDPLKLGERSPRPAYPGGWTLVQYAAQWYKAVECRSRFRSPLAQPTKAEWRTSGRIRGMSERVGAGDVIKIYLAKHGVLVLNVDQNLRAPVE